MIPEIGLVGLYVVTRMLRLATDKLTSGTVKVFGVRVGGAPVPWRQVASL